MFVLRWDALKTSLIQCTWQIIQAIQDVVVVVVELVEAPVPLVWSAARHRWSTPATTKHAAFPNWRSARTFTTNACSCRRSPSAFKPTWSDHYTRNTVSVKRIKSIRMGINPISPQYSTIYSLII